MDAVVSFVHAHPEALLLALGVAPVWAALAPLAKRAIEWSMDVARRLVLVEKSFANSASAEAVAAHLQRHARTIAAPLRERFDIRKEQTKADGIRRTIAYRVAVNSYRVFLYRGAPLFFSPWRSVAGGPDEPPTVRFLRGTVDWDGLLRDAAHSADSVDSPAAGAGYLVVRHGPTKSGGEESGASLSKRPAYSNGDHVDEMSAADEPINWPAEDIGEPEEAAMEALSLTPQMEQVIRDVRFWHGHRQWYRDRGVPWRRGYLLYGKPGNGKTSLVRALAQELQMPVHVFSLAAMESYDFQFSWQAARMAGMRVVLFEDFDAVFHGRENVSGGSLTFDQVLNAIDGIEREDGLLLVVTTNHIEKIDPALGVPDGDNGRSTRPGRIDLVVELPGLDFEGRLKLARRILSDDPEAAERLARERTGDTAAQFQDACVREALSRLWSSAA